MPSKDVLSRALATLPSVCFPEGSLSAAELKLSQDAVRAAVTALWNNLSVQLTTGAIGEADFNRLFVMGQTDIFAQSLAARVPPTHRYNPFIPSDRRENNEYLLDYLELETGVPKDRIAQILKDSFLDHTINWLAEALLQFNVYPGRTFPEYLLKQAEGTRFVEELRKSNPEATYADYGRYLYLLDLTYQVEALGIPQEIVRLSTPRTIGENVLDSITSAFLLSQAMLIDSNLVGRDAETAMSGLIELTNRYITQGVNLEQPWDKAITEAVSKYGDYSIVLPTILQSLSELSQYTVNTINESLASGTAFTFGPDQEEAVRAQMYGRILQQNPDIWAYWNAIRPAGTQGSTLGLVLSGVWSAYLASRLPAMGKAVDMATKQISAKWASVKKSYGVKPPTSKALVPYSALEAVYWREGRRAFEYASQGSWRAAQSIIKHIGQSMPGGENAAWAYFTPPSTPPLTLGAVASAALLTAKLGGAALLGPLFLAMGAYNLGQSLATNSVIWDLIMKSEWRDQTDQMIDKFIADNRGKTFSSKAAFNLAIDKACASSVSALRVHATKVAERKGGGGFDALYSLPGYAPTLATRPGGTFPLTPSNIDNIMTNLTISTDLKIPAVANALIPLVPRTYSEADRMWLARTAANKAILEVRRDLQALAVNPDTSRTDLDSVLLWQRLMETQKLSKLSVDYMVLQASKISDVFPPQPSALRPLRAVPSIEWTGFTPSPGMSLDIWGLPVVDDPSRRQFLKDSADSLVALRMADLSTRYPLPLEGAVDVRKILRDWENLQSFTKTPSGKEPLSSITFGLPDRVPEISSQYLAIAKSDQTIDKFLAQYGSQIKDWTHTYILYGQFLENEFRELDERWRSITIIRMGLSR